MSRSKSSRKEPLERQNERGFADSIAEPRFLVIGQVVKPHGIRGEVRVRVYTDLPERFTWLKTVFVGKKNPKPIGVDSVRFHQGWALMKLNGYDDRNAAETLRTQLIQVPEEEGIPLEEGEYYLHQVIGLKVFTDEGVDLGSIVEVIETGANNVFVVAGQFGEVLLPDIDDVILRIEIDAGRMDVHLLPGLMANQ